MTTLLRIFLIESPSPLDYLENRSEVKALEEICSLLDFQAKRLICNSKKELEERIKYISSIFEFLEDEDDIPLCIHLSSHGSKKGLTFGNDLIAWNEFYKIIEPVLENFTEQREVIISISACYAGYQAITNKLTSGFSSNPLLNPPKYLFVIGQDEVFWNDALIAWSLFYHKISKISLKNRNSIQNMLDKVKNATGVIINYHRWDSNECKFKNYKPK